jgi:hypothetical protein
VAPTVGLLSGRITAANGVNCDDLLVELGVMGSGTGAALVGVLLS